MVPDLTAVERYLQDRERTPFFLFAGGLGLCAAAPQAARSGASFAYAEFAFL